MNYILVVLLYAEKRLESVAKVTHLIRSIAVPMRLLLVVNNPTLDSATVRRTFAGDKRTRVIRHDNSGLEFGGYQAAIDTVRDSLPPRIVVMNDTLGTHDVPTRAYLTAFMRQTAVDEEKLVVGTVDRTDRAMSLGGLQSARWMRSHFFGIDRAALNASGGRLYHPEIDQLITASPDPDIFFGQQVTGTLRAHLAQWLFSTSGHRWYGAEPLSSTNCDRMAAKARAILQEKYLSLTWDAAQVSFRQPCLTRTGLLVHKAEKAFRLFRTGLGKEAHEAAPRGARIITQS